MKRVKKKCNGKKQHENEFSLEELLRTTPAVKGIRPSRGESLPEEVVMRCRHCAEGRVVFMREELERLAS